MRILVTGGAGSMDFHMVKFLRLNKQYVVAFAYLSTGHRDAVLEVALVEGILLDSYALKAALTAKMSDVVIHLAGSIPVGESVANPSKY